MLNWVKTIGYLAAAAAILAILVAGGLVVAIVATVGGLAITGAWAVLAIAGALRDRP